MTDVKDSGTARPTVRLTGLLEQLLERARRDPEQVVLLRELATAILDALPAAEPLAPEPDPVESLVDEPETVSDGELDAFVEAFGTRAPAEPVTPLETRPEISLGEVPARMRLKARACRWLAEHGYTTELAALAERINLIAEGKAAHCYLWMFESGNVNPNTVGVFGTLADNFNATAKITELWLSNTDPKREAQLTRLLALSQAALRGATSRVRGPVGNFPFIDEDQRVVFGELKRYSAEQRVFLFGLALKDTVDPDAVGERLEQLAALEQERAAEAGLVRTRQDVFKRLSYHAKRLQNRPHNPAHEWTRVADAVAELTLSGLPESDLGLREALGPVAPLLPPDTPHEQLARVLGDLAVVAREKAERQAARAQKVTEELPPEVKRVAELVGGRTLVIIGGRPNAEAVTQIEETLGCEVDWLESRPHDSPGLFKPHIVKQEVLLVLLLIRWSSHVFSEVEAFCSSSGKHLVRVPAGYNVKKLAQVILEQAGEKLERSKRA